MPLKRLTVDLERGRVDVERELGVESYPLNTPEAFAAVSEAWVRCGWDVKHSYSFTWLGRPIIQLPEDMIRIAEVIHRVQPDLIIETGVAHGGSLVFYASLCKIMGKGRVVGVDIEIRPHNRAAIEAHPLAPYITLIEGSSTDPEVVRRVAEHVKPGDTVFAMLDSNHTKAHVLAELEAYAPLVTVGSYIVATDGVMERLVGAPRTRPEWAHDNPAAAARAFAADHPDFVLEQPPFAFNEGAATTPVTHWPDGYLRRIR